MFIQICYYITNSIQDNIYKIVGMSKITASNINKKMKEITDLLDFNNKPVKKEQIFDSEDEQETPVKFELQSSQIKIQHQQTKANIEAKRSKKQAKKRVNQEQEEYHYEENDEQISTFSADIDEEDQSFQTKQAKGPKGMKNRKIRTTITHEKLTEMNKIFKEFKQMRQAGITNKNINLRAICNQLHLGYSTILHKYRQFRHNSEVKGGALLSSRDLRRKYKKSVQIEEHIKSAMKQTNLTNAVQISKYIHKTRNLYHSRAVICRHLAAVKKQKSISNDNKQKRDQISFQKYSVESKQQVKQNNLNVEQIFSQVFKCLKRNNQKIIYIHEVVYDASQQGNQSKQQKPNLKEQEFNKQDFPLSLYIAVFQNKIILKKIKNGLFLSQDYVAFLESIGQWRNKNLPLSKSQLFLLTNANQIHYDNFEQVKLEIERNRFIKLPAYLSFPSPLQDLLMSIKQKVLQKQKKISHKYFIQSNIMSWRMKNEPRSSTN